MLLYNKAYDQNHTFFRLCTVLINHKDSEIEEERLRIFDFLLAFPVHIASMSLPSEDAAKKAPFKSLKNPYNAFEPMILFQAMAPIQRAVIGSLVSLGVLQRDEGGHARLSVNKELIPAVIEELLSKEESSLDKEAIKFVTEYLAGFKLTGPSGLKARSKLMGYKYDAV